MNDILTPEDTNTFRQYITSLSTEDIQSHAGFSADEARRVMKVIRVMDSTPELWDHVNTGVMQ